MMGESVEERRWYLGKLVLFAATVGPYKLFVYIYFLPACSEWLGIPKTITLLLFLNETSLENG